MENQTKTNPNRDEVSIVDVVAAFIRRRHIFYATLIITTMVGAIYAFLSPTTYEYVTLMESAETSDGDFLVEPITTVSTLSNQWIPEAVSDYKSKNNAKLPFRIVPSNPESTGLIRIASVAATDDEPLVQKLHEQLAAKVKLRQDERLDSAIRGLKGQFESLERAVESLDAGQAGENTGAALAAAIQEKAKIKGRIESMKPIDVLTIARQSVEKKSAGKLRVIILSLVLGAILGVILAFMTQFVSDIKIRLREQSDNTHR